MKYVFAFLAVLFGFMGIWLITTLQSDIKIGCSTVIFFVCYATYTIIDKIEKLEEKTNARL